MKNSRSTLFRFAPSASRAAAACIIAGAAASAASEGAVDYRQHAMAAVGGHMQAIGDILRGRVAHGDHLPMHAAALAQLADIAPTLFPEGSEGGDAEDAIWRQPDDFAAKLAEFREAAAALRAAAESADRDGIGAAAQRVGQSCKGCHDSYRAD